VSLAQASYPLPCTVLLGTCLIPTLGMVGTTSAQGDWSLGQYSLLQDRCWFGLVFHSLSSFVSLLFSQRIFPGAAPEGMLPRSELAGPHPQHPRGGRAVGDQYCSSDPIFLGHAHH
jgi:hypothetical protein